eukprot:351335-Chlamydomonas_euryale.AAC.11
MLQPLVEALRDAAEAWLDGPTLPEASAWRLSGQRKTCIMHGPRKPLVLVRVAWEKEAEVAWGEVGRGRNGMAFAKPYPPAPPALLYTRAPKLRCKQFKFRRVLLRLCGGRRTFGHPLRGAVADARHLVDQALKCDLRHHRRDHVDLTVHDDSARDERRRSAQRAGSARRRRGQRFSPHADAHVAYRDCGRSLTLQPRRRMGREGVEVTMKEPGNRLPPSGPHMHAARGKHAATPAMPCSSAFLCFPLFSSAFPCCWVANATGMAGDKRE